MTIFEETSGTFSMRRVLAFVLTLASIFLFVFTVIRSCEWKVVLVAGGVPMTGTLLLLFFTTWSDVGKIVTAIKGKSE